MAKMSKTDTVIIRKPFNGEAEDYITKRGVAQDPDCKNFQQYKVKHPELDLEEVSFTKYISLFNEYHSQPFVSITQKIYNVAFNAPIIKLRKISTRYTVFYTKQPIAGEIHHVYVTDQEKGRFYRGAQSILLSDQEIIAKISEIKFAQ